MKKNNLFALAISTVMLSSCMFFSVPESTTIEAVGDEIEGVGTDQLAVVSDSYTLTAKKKSKDSDTWILQISLKLSKNSAAPLNMLTGTPVLQLVDDTKDAIEGAEMKIGEGSLDVKTLESLRSMLADSKPGQMVCSFYMHSTDKKQVKEIMKNAKGFLIRGLAGGSSSVRSFSLEGTHSMKGRVDKYPVVMQLTINGSQVTGSYYYINAQGKKTSSTLSLSGTNEGGELNLNEVTPDGTPSGHFVGSFVSGVFNGTFVNNQGKKMPFTISEGGDGDFIEDEMFGDDGEVDVYDGDGDSSIDEYLDEYERFMKRYVSYIKKVDRNDPTFAVEYAKLMQEYQELVDKCERIRGNMSTQQAERYNKINMQLMREMENMQ